MITGTSLDEISKLPRGWDGYDGCTFLPETIEHARRVLTALEAAGLNVDVTPSPNGTILFEWENDYYLEVGRTRGVGYVSK